MLRLHVINTLLAEGGNVGKWWERGLGWGTTPKLHLYFKRESLEITFFVHDLLRIGRGHFSCHFPMWEQRGSCLKRNVQGSFIFLVSRWQSWRISYFLSLRSRLEVP